MIFFAAVGQDGEKGKETEDGSSLSLRLYDSIYYTRFHIVLVLEC